MTRKKPAVTITLNPNTLAWVDAQIEKDFHYADRSHLIEIALREFKEKIESQR
jgi:Arc/MetJ-type ribon-helix-helix transcriptional regulator